MPFVGWGVQALRLQAAGLYNISTLTQLPLRHLQLEITDSVVIAGLNKLGAMAHLETLMIKCNNESDYFGAYPNGGGILPDMNLRASTNLRAVAFNIFVPGGLKVPQGCSVTLLGACGVLTDLSSLSVCTSCTCVENDAEDLSRFLSATFPALTHLKIDAMWPPDDGARDEDGNHPPLDVQLGKNVKHLRALSIRTGSRDVNLGITESLQLTSLEVLAEGELNVTISNLASLAAALQMYRFQWNRSFQTHAQLHELQGALHCLGKSNDPMGRLKPSSGRANGDDFLCELCWMQGTARTDSEAVKAQLAACSCNACWDCLTRAGAFDLLLV